jgi:hypothetical protein
MSSSPHVFGIVVTTAERQQLVRLLERHGTPAQREHLGHLVEAAPDLGSVAELAASVDSPGRMPGVPGAPNGAVGGLSEAEEG